VPATEEGRRHDGRRLDTRSLLRGAEELSHGPHCDARGGRRGGAAVTLGPLASKRIPLEDLQAGMELALGGDPVMKVLVDLTA
jgi:hypothetical protein